MVPQNYAGYNGIRIPALMSHDIVLHGFQCIFPVAYHRIELVHKILGETAFYIVHVCHSLIVGVYVGFILQSSSRLSGWNRLFHQFMLLWIWDSSDRFSLFIIFITVFLLMLVPSLFSNTHYSSLAIYNTFMADIDYPLQSS